MSLRSTCSARFRPPLASSSFVRRPCGAIRRRRSSRKLGSVVVRPERGRRPLEPRTALRLLQRYFSYNDTRARPGAADPRARSRLPRSSSTRAASLRLLCEESEPLAVDRFEDRTRLLGGGENDMRAEETSKGRVVVATFPKLRFQARSSGAGVEAGSFIRQATWCNPLLFSLRAPPVIDAGSGSELKCPPGLSMVWRRVSLTTFDPHQPKAADATPPREG